MLSDADWVLGRLDGTATVLPNPDFFVSMYLRQEAVLISQIEGK
ncbi:MAG: Fic/DOC family N-terminal domain-containing protein [Candidatus Acidiferrales bacterium]